MLLNIFMRKVFIRIWKWILKYKKRLIYGLLALFIGQISFFSLWWVGLQSNTVFAQNSNTQTQNSEFTEKATGWLQEFSFFKNVIYILVAPILIVLWKLVDNSLVYWAIFGFDAVLWQLWTIVRNLANFALWFIFVYKIFEFLIKGKKSQDIKKILTSTVIAWVGIQASWFIMAALIDISTVITYWVWWLPISVLWSNGGDNKFNPYVFKTVVSVDAQNIDNISTYLTSDKWDFYISECEIFTYSPSGSAWSDKKENLILAPKNIYYWWLWNVRLTESEICHYDNQIYYFNNLISEIIWTTSSDNRKSAQMEYDNNLVNIKSDLNSKSKDEIASFIGWWQILQIGDAHATGWVFWQVFTWIKYEETSNRGIDRDNKWSGESKWLKKLDEIIDESYVWVFSSLYSSLLNAWENLRISESDSDNTFVQLLNVMISVGHMLAISIPLLVMMVVFMMRIWILWIAIALSPMIVLVKAFDFEKSIFKWKPLEYLKIENLIPIIFFPAIICFAVSLSTVLVRVITTLNWQDVNTSGQSILWWNIHLDIAWLWVSLWKLIASVMWIAITRFLVWAAVQSSKLWESGIVKGLKNLTTNALWSIPIVPIPWKDGQWAFVWANAAFWLDWRDGILTNITNRVKNTYTERDNKAISALLSPESAKLEWRERQLDEYVQNISKIDFTLWSWMDQAVSLKKGDGTTSNMKFSDFDAEYKKKIIEKINKLWESERINFGNNNSKISFDNNGSSVNYIFDNNTKKYEEQK